MNPIRVAVICDFLEEHWTSMDLVADMLLAGLKTGHGEAIQADRIQPPMTSMLGDQPPPNYQLIKNIERGYNRFWKYPRTVNKLCGLFDLLHVVDHSYSHLIHQLPERRAVVTCHDLDAFRCVLRGTQDRRSLLHRRLASHTLSGFKKAAHVVCDSKTVMQELLEHGLVNPNRVSFAPLGVHPTCSPEPDETADWEACRLLGPAGFTDLLHVGSTIPRKRIDILLHVVANVRRQDASVRLVRVGGPFTVPQQELIKTLGIDSKAILSLPFLRRETLAAVYRRSAMVLQPSESEGFGLPVAEALACGTAVLASDLAVLREVGGEAVMYCPVGDITAWSKAVYEMLRQRRMDPFLWTERKRIGLAQSVKFSWSAYTSKMVAVYTEALSQPKESLE
jgi:glycosyltransferase involved in cell wall biosynthesis